MGYSVIGSTTCAWNALSNNVHVHLTIHVHVHVHMHDVKCALRFDSLQNYCYKVLHFVE